jgi:hypothetical protein
VQRQILRFLIKRCCNTNDSIKDQEQTSTSKEVLTGGYRFVKVDADTRQLKIERCYIRGEK